ncbi:MAG: hypothetical protein ACREIQ_00790 [Nitrospiria bacterium]
MTEEKNEKRMAGAVDFTELGKFCKESYLEGLEAALKGQQEAERLIKEAITQGYAVPEEWLKLSRQWLQAWDEIGGVSSGIPNPLLTLCKQYAESVCGGAEPMLKAAEEAFRTGFSTYEKILATPVRRYAREFNKKGMETVIPG